jgi:hypothetical protein
MNQRKRGLLPTPALFRLSLCCLWLLQVLVYGEQLDLSPFMAEQAMDEGPVTYTLSGVIVHLDQVRSGEKCISH